MEFLKFYKELKISIEKKYSFISKEYGKQRMSQQKNLSLF